MTTWDSGPRLTITVGMAAAMFVFFEWIFFVWTCQKFRNKRVARPKISCFACLSMLFKVFCRSSCVVARAPTFHGAHCYSTPQGHDCYPWTYTKKETSMTRPSQREIGKLEISTSPYLRVPSPGVDTLWFTRTGPILESRDKDATTSMRWLWPWIELIENWFPLKTGD